MSDEFKLTKRHEKVIARIKANGPLRRQADATEAGALGGGFVFWTEKDGKKLPPASTRDLISNGLLRPLKDGLFDDSSSQSFEALP